MPFFSETVDAKLQGRAVFSAWLVFFDFATDPMRVWTGFRTLTSGGYQWRPLGTLGTISGLEIPFGDRAPITTLTLSGVDTDLIAAALDSSDEVKGRACIIYRQFFADDWQPLDSPYAIQSGIMDTMSMKEGATDAAISLTVEWPFTRTSVPAFYHLSDASQKRAYPGDRGLEQVAAMQNKSFNAPMIA